MLFCDAFGNNQLKENVKAILRVNLVEAGVLEMQEKNQPVSFVSGLSFERQKELLIV